MIGMSNRIYERVQRRSPCTYGGWRLKQAWFKSCKPICSFSVYHGVKELPDKVNDNFMNRMCKKKYERVNICSPGTYGGWWLKQSWFMSCKPIWSYSVYHALKEILDQVNDYFMTRMSKRKYKRVNRSSPGTYAGWRLKQSRFKSCNPFVPFQFIVD